MENNEYLDGQMVLMPSGAIVDEPLPVSGLQSGHLSTNEYIQMICERPIDAVQYICASQSDANPNKKGGINIAYRPEILFLRSRPNYTIYENNIMDVLLAEMSSHPDQKVYEIPIRDLDERLGYAKGSNNGYQVLKKALPLLKEKVLMELNVPTEDGMHIFRIPWFMILDEFVPNGSTSVKNHTFKFRPTPYFEAFVKAAGLLHGAYYSTTWLSKLSSEYSRNMFYVAETFKNYKAYPTAMPGVVEISLEELQLYLGYTSKYRVPDITRLLDKAKKDIDAVPDMDVTFTYEKKKSGRSTSGFLFKFVDLTKQKKIVPMPVPKEEPKEDLLNSHKDLVDLLKDFGLTIPETKAIITVYESKHRTMMEVMRSIMNINSMKNPRSKFALLKYKLESGQFEYVPDAATGNKKPAAKTKFHNFEERDYDYNDLEQRLLNRRKEA